MFAILATILATTAVVIVLAVAIPTIRETIARNQAEERAAHKARVDAHFKKVTPQNTEFAFNRNQMNRLTHETTLAMATGYGFTK